jgi:hypothetical protein
MYNNKWAILYCIRLAGPDSGLGTPEYLDLQSLRPGVGVSERDEDAQEADAPRPGLSKVTLVNGITISILEKSFPSVLHLSVTIFTTTISP